jgi:hypothetical protein
MRVLGEADQKKSAQWVGPYLVLAVEGVNATIKRGRSAIKVHLNRLKPFLKKGGGRKRSHNKGVGGVMTCREQGSEGPQAAGVQENPSPKM